MQVLCRQDVQDIFVSIDPVSHPSSFVNGYNKTRVNPPSHNRSCECKKSSTRTCRVEKHFHCKLTCRAWRLTIEVGIMHYFLHKTCIRGWRALNVLEVAGGRSDSIFISWACIADCFNMYIRLLTSLMFDVSLLCWFPAESPLTPSFG